MASCEEDCISGSLLHGSKTEKSGVDCVRVERHRSLAQSTYDQPVMFDTPIQTTTYHHGAAYIPPKTTQFAGAAYQPTPPTQFAGAAYQPTPPTFRDPFSVRGRLFVDC
jgi:hypothetical protein